MLSFFFGKTRAYNTFGLFLFRAIHLRSEPGIVLFCGFFRGVNYLLTSGFPKLVVWIGGLVVKEAFPMYLLQPGVQIPPQKNHPNHPSAGSSLLSARPGHRGHGNHSAACTSPALREVQRRRLRPGPGEGPLRQASTRQGALFWCHGSQGIRGSFRVYPTTVIQGNPPFYDFVFGKPFLLYHRSGHSPRPWVCTLFSFFLLRAHRFGGKTRESHGKDPLTWGWASSLVWSTLLVLKGIGNQKGNRPFWRFWRIVEFGVCAFGRRCQAYRGSLFPASVRRVGSW